MANDHVFKTGKVGVVAAEFSVGVDDRVDGADGFGIIVHRIQIRDHVLFVWDRDIDRAERFFLHKCLKFFPGEGVDVICIVGKALVDRF